MKPLFQATGSLNNTVDPLFRPVSTQWPVLAFAHNLGTVVEKTVPVVYAVGCVRDPLVQVLNVPTINSLRGPYYFTRYNGTPDMVYSTIPHILAKLMRPPRSLRSSMITQMLWRVR